MRRPTLKDLRLANLAATAAALSACSGGAPDPEVQIATIDRYCVECHNDSDYTGELSLEGRTIDEHRRACRSLREGRQKASRPRHAAAG